MKDPDCELCRLETITREYYRCDDFVIIDCMHCEVPMIVTSEHIDPMDFSVMDLRVEMYKKIIEIGESFYNESFYKGKRFFVDMQERKIPTHLHWHARLPRKKKKASLRGYF